MNTDFIDSFELGPSKIEATQCFTYCKKDADKKQKPWVCVISGIDPEYGYKRDFVNSKQQNLKPPYNDFVKLTWQLQNNLVYQYNNFLCDFKSGYTSKGYFAVTNDKIKTLKDVDVRRALNMRIKGELRVSRKTLVEEGFEHQEKTLEINKNKKKFKKKDEDDGQQMDLDF